MPLPKPDKEEIARICRARKIGYDRENLFEPVSDAALLAISGGYIDQPRAKSLLQWIEDNPAISALYPNSQLEQALRSAVAPGEWSPDKEHDLLRFISHVYQSTSLLRDNLHDLLENPPALFGDLYSPLFDAPAEQVSFSERLCAFTGSFAYGSRRECYEAVRQLGGAPIKVMAATDYLFVSAEHIKGRVLSSSMIDGICIRMIFGALTIYPEKHFQPH